MGILPSDIIAIFRFEIPTYQDMPDFQNIFYFFLLHRARVKAGKVLPSRQMIWGYADSEGVAPGYSDTAFQAKGH